MQALIVYSGGMDSTTLLYQYKLDIKLAVSFDYGSKHNKKELEFAKYHCELLGIEHIIIPLRFINQYFKSDLLLTGGEIPDGHYEDRVMTQTVVPFRNGIMLSIATGLAESHDLDTVLIANHRGDHAIYPDCRDTFIFPMREAMYFGTYNQVQLMAPYTAIDKGEIAKLGLTMDIDYSQTWSCYRGQDIHCGTCGTCIERREALKGFDPTRYLK